jgi:hypothetical protein
VKKEAITLLGLGDIIVDREKPKTMFQHVAEVLRSADITFANCDQIYSDKGYLIHGFGSNSDPKNIPALLYAGLDVISLANNHAYDWGKEALIDTMFRLKEVGLPFVGVGRNIAEARQPIILDRKGNKVGFLAYSSVHPKGSEAEDDKPGLAPIRVRTFYEPLDDTPGASPQIVTIPYKEDLEAMVQDIKKLKTQVDVLVVSFHWGVHRVPRIIPMYCFEIGHAAIDAGADLILGTHTHILKGIEVYKGKGIFYSTNNFAAELGIAQYSNPENARYLKNLKKIGEKQQGTTEAYRREVKATLIAKLIIEGGKIKKLSYIPCFINEHQEPEIVTKSDPRGQEVYRYLEDISKSECLPVNFSWDGDEVLIKPEATLPK